MSALTRKAPRVVFLGHVARMSGGEIALLRLVTAMAGHVEPIVILGGGGPPGERLPERGVTTPGLPVNPQLRDVRKDAVRLGGGLARTVPAVAGYVRRLRTRLKELEPDLVHTNTLKAALYGGLAARLAGIPVVWHIRDRIADDYLPRSAVRLV